MTVTYGALERATLLKNKNGLKVTKGVTLFAVLCQNQKEKTRLMLGYIPTH